MILINGQMVYDHMPAQVDIVVFTFTDNVNHLQSQPFVLHANGTITINRKGLDQFCAAYPLPITLDWQKYYWSDGSGLTMSLCAIIKPMAENPGLITVQP